ncbi:MAG TPA: M67 family metallopeptidase [Terriglobia bacterium]|jgi:proteasome lid subunit RPN8/RPN11|nr:M67 family metallopeptidase [Terriglobia bacterium]
MALKLNSNLLAQIREHGMRDYPNECCGVLLGRARDGTKDVIEVVPLRNLRVDRKAAQEILPLENPSQETERNRFLIDPRDQLQVEKDARARGLEVVGYYHSHPDHPARPSVYDRDHAWPWYSYVIMSVWGGSTKDVTSWVLTGDGTRFESEEIEVVNCAASS